MNKFNLAFGLVGHALFAIIGIIIWQGGIWTLGVALLVYAIANVFTELVLVKQHEVITLLTDKLAQHVRNN